MSKYSGKCDFGDTWEIIGKERILNARIFIGNNIVPLRIDSYKDALPYFPRIVSVMTSDSDNTTIILSGESFVDEEERRHLESVLNTIKAYYRKCKRIKQAFDTRKAAEKISWYSNEGRYFPIIDAVARDGDMACVPSTVHKRIHDIYRTYLYKDMLEAGYSNFEACRWCFGFERYYNDDLPEDVKGWKYDQDIIRNVSELE